MLRFLPEAAAVLEGSGILVQGDITPIRDILRHQRAEKRCSPTDFRKR
jgi:hypothetical protein